MPLLRILWIACFVAGWLALVAITASGAELGADLTIKSARVGVGNRCKAGFWAPVWLTVQSGTGGVRGRIELVVPDGDQVPVIYTDNSDKPLDLKAGQEKSLLLYAKIGPITAPISAQLRDEGRVVWSQELPNLPPRLAATQHLVVSIGASVGLLEAVATIKSPLETSFVATEVSKHADLPDRWWGYDGIDVVVLTTRDSELLAAFSPDQRQALTEWVKLGGRLVLSVGERGEAFSSDSNWQTLLPGKFAEVSPLRERTGLEAFTGTELPWDDEEFRRNRPLVTRIGQVDGAILADESAIASGRPLVVRSASGLGQVIFVGLDLDHPALEKWSGRPTLVANLLQAGSGRREQAETAIRRSVTHQGYEDLVGQLRAALDQFPGVSLVSFTTVAVLTVVYLLLIGPGDFVLLHWLNLPRQVTWLTFSGLAIAFGLVAWQLGADAHGNRARLNQAEIVDVDARTGVVRGTVWTHLYSPQAAQFDLQLQIAAPLAKQPIHLIFAWQGLPGDSLGGLGSRQVAVMTAQPYEIAPPGVSAGITNLPVQTASSKSLAAVWWSATELVSESQLSRDQFGQLAGELVNPLPIELAECLVAYEDRLYRLETLQPGERVRMEQEDALNLEARLTERFIQGAKDVSLQWQQDSVDIPRIVRMLMFHESARGSSYTGLTHRYQSQLDLTDHLNSGRAVLMGRAAEPVVRIHSGRQPLAAESQTWTWWRIVLPVQLPASPASQP